MSITSNANDLLMIATPSLEERLKPHWHIINQYKPCHCNKGLRCDEMSLLAGYRFCREIPQKVLREWGR